MVENSIEGVKLTELGEKYLKAIHKDGESQNSQQNSSRDREIGSAVRFVLDQEHYPKELPKDYHEDVPEEPKWFRKRT